MIVNVQRHAGQHGYCPFLVSILPADQIMCKILKYLCSMQSKSVRSGCWYTRDKDMQSITVACMHTYSPRAKLNTVGQAHIGQGLHTWVEPFLCSGSIACKTGGSQPQQQHWVAACQELPLQVGNGLWQNTGCLLLYHWRKIWHFDCPNKQSGPRATHPVRSSLHRAHTCLLLLVAGA